MAQVIGDNAQGRPVRAPTRVINEQAAKTQAARSAPASRPKSTPSNVSVRGFSATQIANARLIVSVGKSMGMSNRDIQIGLMTAMQESSLRNLGNNTYPQTRSGAEGMGSDHDSVGLFQQRPQSGWGAPTELMDPAVAARKFFAALKKVGNRNKLPLTRAAQAVQRSAYPDAYAKHAGGAAALMQKLGGVSSTEAKKYIAEAGKSTGGAGGGAGATTGGGATAQDTWNKEDFQAALAAAGFGSYLINSNAELKSLFAKAIGGEWTPERFGGEVRSTKWYRERSVSQREYDTLKQNDPRTWAENLADRKEQIRLVANQLGLQLSGGRLDALSRTAYRNGYSDENELYRIVAAELNFDPKQAYGGQIGQITSSVRAAAADYGVAISDETLNSTVEKVVRREQTLEGLSNLYKEQAKRTYSHFAKELDSGMTLREIADPYREQMAQVLEINPQDITLSDKTLQRALLQKDAKTNATSAMPLWQFEETLRKDDRWRRTNNARESLMTVGRQVLSDMGLVN